MKNKKVVRMTLAAMLTALTILIPIVFAPFRIPIGPFTATPAAHVPIIIAMFISPWVAFFVAICSAVGFLITATPIVAARAATHVFFAVIGAQLLKNEKPNIWLVAGVTALVHALAESIVVYVGCKYGLGLSQGYSTEIISLITFGGTVLHHCADFIVAMMGIKVLKSAKLIDKL